MGGRRLLLTGAALLALGAGPLRAAEPAAEAGAQAAPAASTTPSSDIMRKWSRSCALCHVDGNAGAPRIGHPEEWEARLEKGRDVLMQHTVEGFNRMPPLGYCMACDAEDFRALIDFMAGEKQ